MVVNTPPINQYHFAMNHGVRGNLWFPITLNRMVWKKGRIKILMNVLGLCYMTKVSLNSYGESHALELYTYEIKVLT